MRYCVFSRRTWLWLIWCQAWTIYYFVVLYVDSFAQHQWWFLAAGLVMPISALLWLVVGRKRKGMMRLTAHGDGYRWEIY